MWSIHAVAGLILLAVALLQYKLWQRSSSPQYARIVPSDDYDDLPDLIDTSPPPSPGSSASESPTRQRMAIDGRRFWSNSVNRDMLRVARGQSYAGNMICLAPGLHVSKFSLDHDATVCGVTLEPTRPTPPSVCAPTDRTPPPVCGLPRPPTGPPLRSVGLRWALKPRSRPVHYKMTLIYIGPPPWRLLISYHEPADLGRGVKRMGRGYMRSQGYPKRRASCRWTQPRCPTSRSCADAPRATTSQLFEGPEDGASKE